MRHAALPTDPPDVVHPAPETPVHPVARVAGALHVVLGVLLLLLLIASTFLPDPPPPPGERQYGNGSWGWGLMILLIPPGMLIVAVGVALSRGWLRLRFLIGGVIVVGGGYTVALLS